MIGHEHLHDRAGLRSLFDRCVLFTKLCEMARGWGAEGLEELPLEQMSNEVYLFKV